MQRHAWQGIAMSQLIMVIDDEAGVRDLLGDALKLAGFETITAADAMIAQTLLRNTKPDLLIVDINMPMMDGFEFIERIRSNGDNTPALMLSARGDRADITRGLTLGADDYVTKPFSPRELVARINAVLRRSDPKVEGEVIDFEGLKLDPVAHRVMAGDKPVTLGPTEYRMLEFFMTHPDRVYSREQLLDRIWGGNVYVEERTIDVHIRRLRKALEEFGYDRMVQTVRGAGYRFSPRAE